jgi:hypothetical protein
MNFFHTGLASDMACDETAAVISPSGDETRSRVSPEPKENELLRSEDDITGCGRVSEDLYKLARRRKRKRRVSERLV